MTIYKMNLKKEMSKNFSVSINDELITVVVPEGTTLKGEVDFQVTVKKNGGYYLIPAKEIVDVVITEKEVKSIVKTNAIKSLPKGF